MKGDQVFYEALQRLSQWGWGGGQDSDPLSMGIM